MTTNGRGQATARRLSAACAPERLQREVPTHGQMANAAADGKDSQPAAAAGSSDRRFPSSKRSGTGPQPRHTAPPPTARSRVPPPAPAPPQHPAGGRAADGLTHTPHTPPLSSQSVFRMTPSHHEKSRHSSPGRERRYGVITADKSPLCTKIAHRLNSAAADRAPHPTHRLTGSWDGGGSTPERRRAGQGSASQQPRLGAFMQTSLKNTPSNTFCPSMPFPAACQAPLVTLGLLRGFPAPRALMDGYCPARAPGTGGHLAPPRLPGRPH